MFPEQCFDGVVMADVLEHLLDLPSAVAQLELAGEGAKVQRLQNGGMLAWA